MIMKGKLFLLALAIVACFGLNSCDKNKNKTKDPLNGTTWTAYHGDNLLVLQFNLGTISTFFVGDNNLKPRDRASSAPYTITDNTQITFGDLSGYLDSDYYRFKSAKLDGDAMQVNYDHWTKAAGMESPKEHLQAVFKKKAEPKKK